MYFAPPYSADGDIGARNKKNRMVGIFYNPVYLTPPLKGLPWKFKWVPTPAVKKTRMMGYQTVKTVLR